MRTKNVDLNKYKYTKWIINKRWYLVVTAYLIIGVLFWIKGGFDKFLITAVGMIIILGGIWLSKIMVESEKSEFWKPYWKWGRASGWLVAILIFLLLLIILFSL